MLTQKPALTKDEKLARRQRRIEVRTDQINKLAANGFEVVFLAEHHARINGRLDLYLPHGRWWDMKTGKVGTFWRVRDIVYEIFPRGEE